MVVEEMVFNDIFNVVFTVSIKSIAAARVFLQISSNKTRGSVAFKTYSMTFGSFMS